LLRRLAGLTHQAAGGGGKCGFGVCAHALSFVVVFGVSFDRQMCLLFLPL